MSSNKERSEFDRVLLTVFGRVNPTNSIVRKLKIFQLKVSEGRYGPSFLTPGPIQRS